MNEHNVHVRTNTNINPYKIDPMKLSAERAIAFLLISLAACFSPENITAACVDGDCVNGRGTYTWTNGDIYTGEWKNGQRNGEGSMIWPEGDRYTGTWENGENDGQGNYSYPGGEEPFPAEFTHTETDEFGCIKGDCVNGRGTFAWPSGTKYVGDFENGERDGLGIYSFPNGRRILGIWDNGKYVGKERPPQSQWGG